jgi:selenocysteine-specific elongation factor
MILGTAGHIDHGKTALVRALTGVDTDRLPEEKRRGITIDLGFAPLVIDGIGTIGVVDVPGHEAFVRTMVAGASGIDMALLVVAADEGVMPQTKEHLEILSLLGIRHGIVALTKSDLVDDEWLALVRADVQSAIARTSMRDAGILPVSALAGTGLVELKACIAAVASEVEQRQSPDDLFRMPVDRAFTIRGTGTVVTGTVWSGSLGRDSTVLIQPGGKRVRVRGLQSHGKAVDSVTAGDRAAIALAGCEVAEAARGCTLIDTADWATTREMECRVELDESHAGISPRSRLRLHLGTAESGARLARVRRPDKAGGQMLARIVLDDPVLARGGDRFILRLPSPARTIGGGVVLDPLPARRAVVSSAGSGAERIDDPTARLRLMIEAAGINGIAIASMPVRTGLRKRDVDDLIRTMDVIVAGDRVVPAKAVGDLEVAIDRYINRKMRNHPFEAGVSLEEARAAVRAPRAVIDEVLDRLKKSGQVEVLGSVVRPSGWTENLREEERALSDAILHEICTHAAEPPSVGELSGRFGGLTEAMLRRLERMGELQRVAEDRYYSVSAVSGMIQRLRSELETGRIYSPGELREVLGVSRKYLIPFLEFCDRSGVTERREKGREIRSA